MSVTTVFYTEADNAGPTAIEERGAALGMNLVSVFQMITRPQQSNSGSARSFNSTLLTFNPSWFDGLCVFTIEPIAANTNAVTPYDITIENADTSAVIATYTIPANNATLREFTPQVFTPPAGDIKYRMRLPQTAVDNQLQVVGLNIRIQQTGASKSAFCFPLMGIQLAINQSDLVSGDSRFIIGGSTGFLEESTLALFRKVANGWRGTRVWTWETVAGNTGAGGSQFSVRLCNNSGLAEIVTNVHTAINNNTELIATAFADSNIQFQDNAETNVTSDETATGASNSILLAARIRLQVTNMQTAIVPYALRASNAHLLVELSKFSQITQVYQDTSATETGAGTMQAELRSSVDGVSTTAETVQSSVNPNSATKARYTTTFTPTSDTFYVAGTSAGTGSIATQSTYLMVNAR